MWFLSPDRFLTESFLLFSELTAQTYQLLEQSSQGAFVREGTATFYNKERYDWSNPGEIVSVIEESNIVSPGSKTDMRITSLGSQGSRVEVHLNREFIGWRGRLINVGISMSGRTRFFRKIHVRMLRDVEAAVRDLAQRVREPTVS